MWRITAYPLYLSKTCPGWAGSIPTWGDCRISSSLPMTSALSHINDDVDSAKGENDFAVFKKCIQRLLRQGYQQENPGSG